MSRQVVVKPGRERTLRAKHPWLFSGGIKKIQDDAAPGDTVDLISTSGEWLARGIYNPSSQIAVRIWTWNEDEQIDQALIRRRLCSAIDMRNALIPPGVTDACRLVHGESDGMPGVIIDRYGDWLVLQVSSLGGERMLDDIVHTLLEVLPGVRGIYERSDVDVRLLEGLPARTGPLVGDEPPNRIRISEHALNFLVDIRRGQKTGFYLDQRENRQRISKYLYGREVLNCFCYTGAFTVTALSAGARAVTSVDSSAEALAEGDQNLRLNNLPIERAVWIDADVFSELRRMRDRRQSFDAVILDPPKFAPTSAHVNKAARAYKDINLLALKLLRQGGLLVTFSCSGGIDMALFEKIIAGAAIDAGVHVKIVDWLHQASDHPVAMNFPEASYLKGLVCQVYSDQK